MHGTHGREELVGWRGLQDIPGRAGPQGSPNLAIAFDGREHDDSCVWELPEDRRQRVDAVGSRKAHVHQRDVRASLLEREQRLTCGGGLGHEAHVGLGFDDRAQAVAEDGVVFHAQDRNRLRWCACRAHGEGAPG